MKRFFVKVVFVLVAGLVGVAQADRDISVIEAYKTMKSFVGGVRPFYYKNYEDQPFAVVFTREHLDNTHPNGIYAVTAAGSAFFPLPAKPSQTRKVDGDNLYGTVLYSWNIEEYNISFKLPGTNQSVFAQVSHQVTAPGNGYHGVRFVDYDLAAASQKRLPMTSVDGQQEHGIEQLFEEYVAYAIRFSPMRISNDSRNSKADYRQGYRKALKQASNCTSQAVRTATKEALEDYDQIMGAEK